MKKTILITLICMLFLAGCNDNVEEVETLPLETPEVMETETQYYPDTLITDMYNGRTFTILADAAQMNLAPEELTGEPVNDALYNCWARTEESLGITLSGQATTNPVEDTKTSVTAGDLAYNSTIARPSGMSTLVTQGVLQDLNSVPVLNFAGEWWCQGLNDHTDINGSLYITTGSISQLYFHAPFAIAYNLSLAENYISENLYQVVTDGRWTLDYMNSCIADATVDLNGDGKIDEQNDQYAIATEGSTLHSFAAAAGIPFCIDTDDTYKIEFQNENYIDILSKITEVITPETTYYGPGGNGGEIPFSAGRALFYRNMIGWFYNLREMEDDYGIIPMPKYDELQENYISPANPGSCYGVCMPFGWSETDLEFNGTVLEMLCWLCNESMRPAKLEQTLKAKVARDPQSVEMLNLIYQTAYYDLNTIYNFGTSRDLIQNCIYNRTVDQFVSNWMAIREKTQTELSEYITFAENSQK